MQTWGKTKQVATVLARYPVTCGHTLIFKLTLQKLFEVIRFQSYVVLDSMYLGDGSKFMQRVKYTASSSLAIEMPWLAQSRLFLYSFVQMSLENTSLTCKASIPAISTEQELNFSRYGHQWWSLALTPVHC